MGARVVGQFAVAALYERRRCSGISTGGHRPPLQKLKLNLYGRAGRLGAEFGFLTRRSASGGRPAKPLELR